MTGQIATPPLKLVKPKTYVALILDKSGSMGSIKFAAITTINEQIQTIKKLSKNQDVFIYQVHFSDQVDFLQSNVNIEVVNELSLEHYNPSGSTALYDAIGFTIDKMKKELTDLHEDHVSVLFIIVSDGEENDSKEYGSYLNPSMIQSKIKEMQETGRWTFTFLAANVDIMSLSKRMGVSVGNTRAFTASSAGMKIASAATTRGLDSFLRMRQNYSLSTDTGEDSKLYQSSVSFYDNDDETKEKTNEHNTKQSSTNSSINK